MTFGDILDQAAFDADDDSGEYRTAARRWLNLVRSEIADRARWRTAYAIDTFTTAAATTTGLYTLSGYEHLVDDWMFDETNEATISQESHQLQNAADPAKDTTGQPTWWSDAGVDSSGSRRIYLWPVPDAAYVVRFHAYKRLSDVLSGQDGASIDPFFGEISPWGATFTSGVRAYHDRNNNEDANQAVLSGRKLELMIRARMRTNGVAPATSMVLRDVRGSGPPTLGRFDPSQYANR